MRAYPKPGRMGGRLIREVIGFLRTAGLSLPIRSHILIATSGGIDSIALAHLLIKYGRRVGDLKRLRLVHVNHGWRGRHSDEDAAFVRAFGRRMKVPVTVVRIRPPGERPGESWENESRTQRKAVFEQLAVKHRAIVMTAHQADDLAETLLWRLFTGAAGTHGGAIVARHGVEVRPFIRIRKRELQQYLEEEGESWREDSTNHGERFLRARMRKEIMAPIEKQFPRAIQHLIRAALNAQKTAVAEEASNTRSIGPDILFSAAGVNARRPHWELLGEKAQLPAWVGELQLPGGWKLRRQKKARFERWVLEKISR